MTTASVKASRRLRGRRPRTHREKGAKSGSRIPRGSVTGRPRTAIDTGTAAAPAASAAAARPRSPVPSTGASAISFETSTVHIIGRAVSVSSATLNPLQTKPRKTLAMPSPVISGSVGTTSRLASGETSEVVPKVASATGAVPALAASETATFDPIEPGNGLSNRWSGPSRTSMPMKAANDNWKPTSKIANGFRPSTTKRRERQHLPLVPPPADPAAQQHDDDHDGRADDRRRRAHERDDEHRRRRGQKKPHPARRAKQSRQPDHDRRQAGDVQPADRQHVRRAGPPEGVEPALVDAGRVTDDHSLHHLVDARVGTPAEVIARRRAQPVEPAGDAATPADHHHRISPEHDLDALVKQLPGLIEA